MVRSMRLRFVLVLVLCTVVIAGVVWGLSGTFKWYSLGGPSGRLAPDDISARRYCPISRTDTFGGNI
jgi:hypothetical protein